MSSIDVTRVSKSYGKNLVLDAIDLDIQDGEFVCLLGPSGCGKTTLLRSIAGLETPESGRIRLGADTVFDGTTKRVVPPEKRDIGMVFQSFALWPHKSVFENVAYPLYRRGLKGAAVKERVLEALRLVDLPDREATYPHALSGGQQQRVAVARALVAQPRLLLLDEPLASLDANLRGHMRRELRSLQRRLGATAVYVTHDKEDAGGLADKVYVLQDGSIVQAGTPSEVFARPKTAFVAEFVGFDNFLPGTVVGIEGDTAVVRVSGTTSLTGLVSSGTRVGDRVTLAARSRSLELTAPTGVNADLSLVGSIVTLANLGDDVELVISDGEAELIARVSPSRAQGLSRGSTVAVAPGVGAEAVVLTDSRKSIQTSTSSQV